MAEEVRNDITINGGGTVAAGTYETVTINGGGTVSGDIVCTTLRINGAATCQGAVKAATLAVNGTGTFNGSVQAGEMSVNGDASVRAGLGVRTLSLRGNLTVDGGIAAHEIDLRGYLRTPGDITADLVRGEGALEARDLTCETLDMGVYGPSVVRNVSASRVTLRSPRSFAEFFTFFTTKEFKAETIRASEVWLEHTVAGTVSAGNATIGAGSRIGLVHYSGAYSKRDDAQVAEERKA